MQIYIFKDGEQNGPYSIEDVDAYLEDGTLLPTDLACQDGMTEWVPVSQIQGVTMPGDSVATPVPPSQPVPNGNKKKILIGVGAGIGLLALMAGIWFFFIRDAGEKEQLSKNNENNSTTASVNNDAVIRLEEENKIKADRVQLLEEENRKLMAEVKSLKQGKENNNSDTKPVKVLKKEDVVGSYEAGFADITFRFVLLESGVVENYFNGRKEPEDAKWKIQGAEVHIEKGKSDGTVIVNKIELNGDLTMFARIRNGKREGFQNRTYKKIRSEKATPSKQTELTSGKSTSANRQVINVTTAQELIDAIDSNRTIILKPGDYIISGLKQSRRDHVAWQEVHDGDEIIINDISNLEIRSDGDRPARILVKPRYANVLTFQRCRKITFKNLVLAHTIKGYCVGGVVRIHDGADFKINDCKLMGSGHEGLIVNKLNGLSFRKSSISGCTYSIMNLSDASNVTFADSEFIDNDQAGLFRVHRCEQILFTHCQIQSNSKGEGGGPMFVVSSSSDVVLKDSTIRNNISDYFLKREASMQVENCRFENNNFRKSKYGF